MLKYIAIAALGSFIAGNIALADGPGSNVPYLVRTPVVNSDGPGGSVPYVAHTPFDDCDGPGGSQPYANLTPILPAGQAW